MTDEQRATKAKLAAARDAMFPEGWPRSDLKQFLEGFRRKVEARRAERAAE